MFSSFGRTAPPEHMVKMLRESEPNAVKRLLKFLEDYDKCTPTQRDQVFVPSNEEGIISLFLGAIAVFKKHHSKSKQVSIKDVVQSLKLLEYLGERSPRALGNRWEIIRVHVEAFLDEDLNPEINIAAFGLLFNVVDNSVLSGQKSFDTSIEELFCKAFHWPKSYRLRVEPSQPCEFLSRTNQLSENFDTFNVFFEKFVHMILAESKSNRETQWWMYMKDKILSRFVLSLGEKAAGSPQPCPVPVAACLVEFFYHCLEVKKITGILESSRDIELALSLFNVVMTSVQSTAEKLTAARSKCVTILERWTRALKTPINVICPRPFQDDIDCWMLHVVRCIVMFFQSWKDVKGLKNEQDLDTAIKCITVFELVSRLNINSDSWKIIFRSILDISNYYLGVTDEQRRGDATHPPDRVLSGMITDGVFALLLRRVSPPEFWEHIRHREHGIARIFHSHTTVDSWTRVLLVVARRLAMHLSSSTPNGSMPAFLDEPDSLSWRVGGRSAPKSAAQGSPWQHRVDPTIEEVRTLIDQQLQPFFSLGCPWFPPSTWSKNTDCCRAWDRLISLIPPKKKVDRDFSIAIQALDCICEWFLEAGVLPTTCLQYVISWLLAAFENSGDQVSSASLGSGSSHVEVTLSVSIRMFNRILMHPNYPISPEDPMMLPLCSVLHNLAFKYEFPRVQIEAYDILTQLLHVIPHSVLFLVPIALSSKLFTKRHLQSLSFSHQNILCRFIVSVAHIPGYIGTNRPSSHDELCENVLSALHQMLQLFQDSELYSQLMWACWLFLQDASTSSNAPLCCLLLSEFSEALDFSSQSNSHLITTLQVIRAAAVLIPSLMDHQQNLINQILAKLSQGLSSKINQSSISKMAELTKNEYSDTVNNFVCTIREWLLYCVLRVPHDILDQVYEALIVCVFDGTNIYQQLQTAIEMQPTDWSEVNRIIASRNNIIPRSECSIAAEVCLCSLSSFMSSLPSLSLAQVTCDFASSLCQNHPRISLMMGNSRILTFVEDQSSWGKIWVVTRDTTGTRLWSANSLYSDDGSASAPLPVGGAPPSKSKVRSNSSESDQSSPSPLSTLAQCGVSSSRTVEDTKDHVDAQVMAGECRDSRDLMGTSVNDDELIGGIFLLNDEDFTRPPGKLAQFQKSPHTSRVEMLRHLMDYLDETIPSSSVALDGSQATSCSLIQSRNQEHARLSVKLKALLQEEHAKAERRKELESAPFPRASPPPVADKRLWKMQFTRQLLSSFMFASAFSLTSDSRMLSAADELDTFRQFDSIPSRDNLSVLISFPPAGSSPDADEFLASMKVHATELSDSEFFLSTPDRDIRFVVSSCVPPVLEDRWSSPVHVQLLWHARDAGRFDVSSSSVSASCHCVVLQPIGANLIRVEQVLTPNGTSPPIPSEKSRSPFLRGSILNVNIIEPAVLACVVSLTNHGHVARSVVSSGLSSPSLLKRRFDVLQKVFQKYERAASFFEVAEFMHSQ